MTLLQRAPRSTALLIASLLTIAACGSSAKNGTATTAQPAATTAAASSSSAAGPASTTTTASSSSAVTTAAPSAGNSGGSAIFTVDTEPTGLNYNNADDNSAQGSYLMQHVWPWAYVVDPTGVFVLNTDLLTKVEVTKSDPQTIVYTLNPKAVWSDGTPIGIDDFKYSWIAQNGAPAKNADGTDKKDDKGNPVPLYNAAATNGYEDVKSVESTDGGTTITVVFNKPYADWQAMFGPVIPFEAFKAEGGGDEVKGFNEGFKKDKINLANVVSGAAYKMSEYKVGQSATLVRNDKWWGAPAKLEKIIVPFIADPQTPDALANGEADVIYPQAQLDLVQKVKGESNVAAQVGFGTFWEHLDFNQTNPILADVNVRKAIAKAIDRSDIVTKVIKPFDAKAQVLDNRMYFPGSAGYVDNGGDYAKADLVEAKRLLDAAGWKPGTDGILAKGGKKLSLRLVWYKVANKRRESTAQLVQNQLKQIGIDIQAAGNDNGGFLSAGDFDIALFGWTGGSVLSANTSIFADDGGQNYGKNKDPKIRQLFDQANVELDATKRTALMNQIDVLVWNDMAQLPIAQVPELLAWNNRISGPQYDAYQGPTWNEPFWTAK